MQDKGRWWENHDHRYAVLPCGGDGLPDLETLRFAVDAALLSELGENLIGSDSVALAELVKNAYDADATHVIVTFEGVTGPDGRITVADNGHGMTLDQVRDCWMRIGTTHKVKHPLSPRFGRRRTGEKGVGRFAARRLSARMTLQSISRVADGQWEQITVEFDWQRYARGLDVGAVEAVASRERTTVERPPGTILTLHCLQRVWSRSEVLAVRREARGLMSPHSAVSRQRPGLSVLDDDPGLSVVIVSDEFPELEGDIADRFLELAWGRLEGIVGSDGRPVYTVAIRGRDGDHRLEPDVTFPELPGAEFVIHHFVYTKKDIPHRSIEEAHD